MTSTLVCGYLFGWVIAAIGVAVIIGKLSDPVRPQRYPIPLTVAASAAWPLVVLGAAQMATIALVANVARSWNGRSIRRRASAFAANELDDLLDEWLSAPDARCAVPYRQLGVRSEVGGGLRASHRAVVLARRHLERFGYRPHTGQNLDIRTPDRSLCAYRVNGQP
jgi:hypothetical protein